MREREVKDPGSLLSPQPLHVGGGLSVQQDPGRRAVRRGGPGLGVHVLSSWCRQAATRRAGGRLGGWGQGRRVS